jgi:hypothetical protein
MLWVFVKICREKVDSHILFYRVIVWVLFNQKERVLRYLRIQFTTLEKVKSRKKNKKVSKSGYIIEIRERVEVIT